VDYLTADREDEPIVSGMNNKRLRFTTWRDLYPFFKKYELETINKQAHVRANFVVSQFTDYLEKINMAPFDGWELMDFQAFLRVNGELDSNECTRVKIKDN
jgi:hypothetical protein